MRDSNKTVAKGILASYAIRMKLGKIIQSYPPMVFLNKEETALVRAEVTKKNKERDCAQFLPRVQKKRAAEAAQRVDVEAPVLATPITARILEFARSNDAFTVQEASAKLQEPTSVIWPELRRLERQGTIQRKSNHNHTVIRWLLQPSHTPILFLDEVLRSPVRAEPAHATTHAKVPVETLTSEPELELAVCRDVLRAYRKAATPFLTGQMTKRDRAQVQAALGLDLQNEDITNP